MTVKRWIVGLAMIVLVAGATQAQGSINVIINGGFETGDFTGWTVNSSYAGLYAVVTAQTSANGQSPKEGTYFAQLTAGEGTNVYTLLSQPFTVSTGATATVSFWAFFQANDSMPYNDNAFVSLLDGSGNPVTQMF